MKNYRVSARISEKAYKDLATVSERMNVSKSEIIERLIRCQNLIVIDGLDKFLPALKLAEGNLNQVAARLRKSFFVPKLLAEPQFSNSLATCINLVAFL